MNTDDIDVKVGDVVIWAYIPKKTTKNTAVAIHMRMRSGSSIFSFLI